MSLFGNSYEDDVYRKRYPRTDYDESYEWWKEKFHLKFTVNCEQLSSEEVQRVFTRLVNYPNPIDDYDIITDDAEEELENWKSFQIVGYYDNDEQEKIMDVLDAYELEYTVDNP